MAGKPLRDVIAPDLDVLFCGINPSLMSAERGHHFARPGNRFWPAIHLAALTPRLFTPDEDGELPTHGLGITNVVARPTRAAAELTADELRDGAAALAGLVAEYRPRVLAVQIAGRLPVHISSSGHVLLAHGPREVRDRVLERPMERYTPATITSPDRLRAALDLVRGQGYALLAGHVHENATGIAVPVRDGLGEVVAALSVIVPNDERAPSGVPALLAAARGVSRSLRPQGRRRTT